ncbi:alkylmercury lyase domain protein [Podospora conica]|nr:alkylmercury lyase domain protein [Schizothecium conicum]
MADMSLHSFITGHFLHHERPPSLGDIALQFECSFDAARAGLRALADLHGVVLHPNSDEIWVAHPYSAAPTTCIVSTNGHGGRRWWANCVWCGFGILHAAIEPGAGSGKLEARIGGIGDNVTLTVENGRLVEEDFVVHFPVAMREAWDNVIYTCSVQQLFRDEAEVDEWCRSRGIAKGDVRPVRQIWEFAGDWYARDRAETGWAKWTVQEATGLFRRHGLCGPTWDLGGRDGRF